MNDANVLESFVKLVIDEPFNFEQNRNYKKINISNKKEFSNWKLWSNDNAKELNTICGNFMRKFDYGNELKWLELLNTD